MDEEMYEQEKIMNMSLQWDPLGLRILLVKKIGGLN